MATRTASLAPSVTTSAQIQALAQFIEDTLVTTGGWVVTSDTGQTLPSALTNPAAANTKQGYRVYRMNDSLQATSPIFVRIDFGSGGAVSVFAIWITIGTGSNGSGTITGVIRAATQFGPNTNSGTALNCYGSADAGRVQLGMFANGNGLTFIFSIERSKDSSGNDTGTAIILIRQAPEFDGTSGTSLSRIFYGITAGGTQAAEETGLSYCLTTQNPSQTFGGDIGVGVIIPFRGVAQQPGIGMVIVNSSDVGAQGNFAMSVYGTSHTFQQMDANAVPQMTIQGGVGNDANARMCIRFD